MLAIALFWDFNKASHVLAYFGKYDLPAELLVDDSLSRDEKIRMLEQWRDDEKALIQASDEGMQGDKRPDILKQVKKALISIRVRSDAHGHQARR